MSDTRIRLMQGDDCVHVAGVLNHAIEHGVAHFGTELVSTEDVRSSWESTRDAHPWLIAQTGSELGSDGENEQFLGFAKAAPWKTRKAYTWSVESGIYIAQRRQGKGVGKALYRTLFDMLNAQGYRVVLAGVSVPNPASERLHESMGMERVGELDPAGFKHGQWVAVRLYQKLLGACDEDDKPGPIRAVQQVWDERHPSEQVRT